MTNDPNAIDSQCAKGEQIEMVWARLENARSHNSEAGVTMEIRGQKKSGRTRGHLAKTFQGEIRERNLNQMDVEAWAYL